MPKNETPRSRLSYFKKVVEVFTFLLVAAFVAVIGYFFFFDWAMTLQEIRKILEEPPPAMFAIAFLIQILITHQMQKAVMSSQEKIKQNFEGYQQELRKELADYQKNLDEKLQQNTIMFSEFHKRRPDIFLQVCDKLNDVHAAAKDLLNNQINYAIQELELFAQAGTLRKMKTPETEKEADLVLKKAELLTRADVVNSYLKKLTEKTKIANKYIRNNRIFIDNSDAIENDISESLIKIMGFIETSIEDDMVSENPQWLETQKHLDDFAKKIRSYEKFFRDTLLGTGESIE